MCRVEEFACGGPCAEEEKQIKSRYKHSIYKCLGVSDAKLGKFFYDKSKIDWEEEIRSLLPEEIRNNDISFQGSSLLILEPSNHIDDIGKEFMTCDLGNLHEIITVLDALPDQKNKTKMKVDIKFYNCFMIWVHGVGPRSVCYNFYPSPKILLSFMYGLEVETESRLEKVKEIYKR